MENGSNGHIAPTRTIFHVDRSAVWRQGLRMILPKTELRVVGGGALAGEALERVREGDIDIVLCELDAEDMSGFELLAALRDADFPGRFAFLTSDSSPEAKNRATRLGAGATLVKGLAADELIRAVRKLSVAKPVSRKRRKADAPLTADSTAGTHRLSVLTAREREALALLTHGMTNRQIAEQLAISYETVKEHVQHILRKLGADDRTQAAIWAVKNGM